MKMKREPEWQPIETAPKDGTLIDLYVPSPYPYPLEDEGYSVTIGRNDFANTGDPLWPSARSGVQAGDSEFF